MAKKRKADTGKQKFFRVFLACSITICVALTFRGSNIQSTDTASIAMAEQKEKDLPRWNLERHFGYTSPSDPAIDTALDTLEEECKQLQQKYDGKLDVQLLPAIKAYERYPAPTENSGSCCPQHEVAATSIESQ
eukprot:1188354-Prorocentrum_minimum.AAC.3